MLSYKNYLTLKYFLIVCFYQLLFYLNGTNLSSLLLIINFGILLFFFYLSFILFKKDSSLIIKFNKTDFLILIYIIGYFSSLIKGVLPLFTSIALIFYLLLIWINIKIDGYNSPNLISSYINGSNIVVDGGFK